MNRTGTENTVHIQCGYCECWRELRTLCTMRQSCMVMVKVWVSLCSRAQQGTLSVSVIVLSSVALKSIPRQFASAMLSPEYVNG